MSDSVTIFEVGPRDGLQNEPRLISVVQKVRLVDLLSRTGLRKIEVTSFVSPKWVPQMADAAEVLEAIDRRDGATYAALTPNLRGLKAAMHARTDEIAIFASASEGFSQKNINCTLAESLARFGDVLAAAREAGLPVRGYVSCVTDCPYDRRIAPEAVLDMAAALLEMGCYEVSLGDTIGAATPKTTGELLSCLTAWIDPGKLAGHFHDTESRALNNIRVALDYGLRTFDSSVAGLGGCPYAPGARGNVATEEVCDLMERLGHDTGIDRARLSEAAAFALTLRSDA